VRGVERQPVLVLLGRRPNHAEPQQRHFFFVWSFSERVSSTPVLRFSARFSLMDFPDFLDMVLRGDLSLMRDLSERKPERLRAPTLRLAPSERCADGRAKHSGGHLVGLGTAPRGHLMLYLASMRNDTANRLVPGSRVRFANGRVGDARIRVTQCPHVCCRHAGALDVQRSYESMRTPTHRGTDGLSARFDLRCLHTSVHASECGGRVPVVAELQPPPSENTTDTPAPAASTGSRVDALVLNELHNHGRVPHDALVVERP